ncbi:hypothetical protein CFP56_002225 [Quercus suber]|uniref:Uncharacterized protein n=1 Tax=Quercus suber TaxID=58331 RepID=A0AAW0MAH2_QUESU
MINFRQARDISTQCKKPSIQSHQTTNNGQLSISILVFTKRKFKSLKKNYLGKRWRSTVIEWGDYGKSLESSTFKLSVANFMARGWFVVVACIH